MDTPGERFPLLVQVVLDTTDARGLAEFHRRLLGYRYRPGDEPPSAGAPDPAAGLAGAAGRRRRQQARLPVGEGAAGADLAGGPATAVLSQANY
jgi:hypothetical protein